MKPFLAAICIVISCCATAQKHSLKPLWQTDSVVAVPESVLYDAKSGLLYVALIDGEPWGADGKGGVAQLKTDGSSYDSTWVTGLNAPKGMGIFGNRLYVADISEVVVIDMTGKKVEKKIPVAGAQALNDITISDKGIVYVSDSKTGIVWRIEGDKPTVYLENMQGVNGLKAVQDNLIVAAGKTIVKADGKKKTTTLATLPQPIDGIEPLGNGDFLMSTWSGTIYYVQANGTVDTLLDTSADKKQTADIGYDPVKKIVYVPTFFAKTVSAYQLD